MILSMDSNTDNLQGKQTWIPTPISLRADQREWLDEEKVRQRHGNRSLIVQEALDLYRETLEARQRLVRIA